jgi:hypothetical protein
MTWQDQYQQEDRSAAELFQRYIVPRITSLWGKDLVDRARIRVGENVLDVACGMGVVTRLAAQKSGTDGARKRRRGAAPQRSPMTTPLARSPQPCVSSKSAR